MAAATPATVVKPRRPWLATAARPVPAAKPTVEEVQVQIAHSFHDAREWVSATLPGPVGGAVNDVLFLVRRLVLPTGEHVGIHGTAECVAAKDCSGKNLTGAQHHDEDLQGVDFTGANLTHANFRNADFNTSAGPLPAASRKLAFRYGYFPGMGPLNADNNGDNQVPPNFNIAKIPPDFSNANLTGADFRGANLNGANLTGANLTGANLTGANLNGSNFTGANLTGANITGANLIGAVSFSLGPNLVGFPARM